MGVVSIGTGSERPNSRKAHTRKAHFIGVQKGPLLDTRKAHLFYILPERSTNRNFYGININGS